MVGSDALLPLEECLTLLLGEPGERTGGEKVCCPSMQLSVLILKGYEPG